ncbi:MAG TPA: nucleoside triphosphate pyrophosphatase [Steroidobacteraceae bacterium]|jgi:septum formation protein|nr:nucleoside triphosphate pyrophosphatase [Steroidobacteraceae bacterium]
MSVDFVFLASGSPRRRQLLLQIGVPFQVLSVSVDEAVLEGEEPLEYASRLAASKAGAGLALCAESGTAARPVLAADTAVVIGGEILGKPKGADDGVRMLRLLSGRTHAVLTCVALAAAGRRLCRVSRSEVTFREIAPDEAREYWDTGEPADKAGGYAIQGLGAVFVEQLRGSFSGVMGLPLFETSELLEAAGVPRWRVPAPHGKP